jgi:hypothetical protein
MWRVLGVLLFLVSCAQNARGGPSEAEDREQDRLHMVSRQIEARDVRDPHVLRAMRKVPRHLFVSEAERPYAYDDRPLPIGYRQTISQPYIVALMTELADVKPGDRVLEVGTGSGYQWEAIYFHGQCNPTFGPPPGGIALELRPVAVRDPAGQGGYTSCYVGRDAGEGEPCLTQFDDASLALAGCIMYADEL